MSEEEVQSPVDAPAPAFDDDLSDLSDIDENFELPENLKINLFSDIQPHKKTEEEKRLELESNGNRLSGVKKKNIRRDRTYDDEPASIERVTSVNESNEERKRRLMEERMDAAIKSKSTRRKNKDEDDLEKMQDEKIDMIKEKMIRAAQIDAEKIADKQIASEKLKLLPEVSNLLIRADLAISILDNNLLEAVRLWLEPLPDASLPAYEIQKNLIHSLAQLPIKTDHLLASGIGKVMVFYQRCKRVEPSLKKIVEKLIADWTRPIMKKSDNYKDKQIAFAEYDKRASQNSLPSSAKRQKILKAEKTLYEESAERRNRAAIPSARTTAYKIAPRVDINQLKSQSYGNGKDERFKRINQKLAALGTKRKTTKKGGVSIEGRDLTL